MEGRVKLSLWRQWTSKQCSYPITKHKFSFPGNNDPLNWGTASQGSGNTVPYGNWSEEFPNGPSSSSNTPDDKRLVGSIGPTTLYPFNGNIDNIQEFTLAYIQLTRQCKQCESSNLIGTIHRSNSFYICLRPKWYVWKLQ
ncbi:MAG: hypothetical protein CM15mP65_23140 [Crocinitomicaceae bacterium]|nr:MAG: hypothetical protein CM15mP65_23140 [Crocinitomicaceae bacterium]